MDRSAAEDARPLTLFDARPVAEPGVRRRLALAGRIVEFRFERRVRRTIALHVDAHGLSVLAPRRAAWREIEDFVHAKARWIVGKLDTWALAGRPSPFAGRSGETLPLFGAPVTLEVCSGRRAVTLCGERLHVEVPEPRCGATVRDVLVRWFRRVALEALTPRAAHYAARLRVPLPPVAISNARTQWGVCMASGRIRLAWRLAHLPPELSDYVVAHETAHLLELNHSRRFWQIVTTLYPEWRAARERLRRAGAMLPEL